MSKCEHCDGKGEVEDKPLFASQIWVREPMFSIFDSEAAVVEKMDVANCYARRGSHWIRYIIAEDESDGETET